MTKKLKCAELKRHIFLHLYANVPEVMRDKPCGLSWNDVYKLLNEEG